ncbi:hypothetical protein [Actinomyces sp. S4-C9]|uniref:hypothetical protein n=1 Tax=Actinomyces sp. S4-C9 TaxID=1219581 RepID=UPI00050F8D0C|nr:hypothetical protein [Actinomyces sp. S4-C9]KGF01230.1 hypothetical protein HMPREF1628_06715 [Actinomyces sp. S4-C9]
MFETKKTLIAVYKDELLVNQLKKLIETDDDTDCRTVGTKDDSISVVSWTEKVWLANKDAGNIQGKILFLGDIKGTDELIPVIDTKFDDCGVKFGWAGNQAILYVEPEALTNREEYDEFLAKLSDLPVPSFLKAEKDDIVSTGAADLDDENVEESEFTEIEKTAPAFVNVARRLFESGAGTIEKVGKKVAAKSEEIFRNKSLMKRQMMFYGVVHLYTDGLDSFMEQ